MALGRDHGAAPPIGGTITVLCFCRDGQFCHKVLLVEWLTRHYAGGFVGEGVRLPAAVWPGKA
jgi:hypothetical protein